MSFEDAVRRLKIFGGEITRDGWAENKEAGKSLIIKEGKLLISRPPYGEFPVVLWGEDVMTNDWRHY